MLSQVSTAISSEKVKEIIANQCRDSGLVLPENWKAEFDENIHIESGVKKEVI